MVELPTVSLQRSRRPQLSPPTDCVQSGGVEGAALFSISSKKNLKDIMEGLCSDCLRGCLAPLGLRDRVTMTRVNRHSRGVGSATGGDVVVDFAAATTCVGRSPAGVVGVGRSSQDRIYGTGTAIRQPSGRPDGTGDREKTTPHGDTAVGRTPLLLRDVRPRAFCPHHERSSESEATAQDQGQRQEALGPGERRIDVKEDQDRVLALLVPRKLSAPVKDGSTSKKTKTGCSHWCRECHD